MGYKAPQILAAQKETLLSVQSRKDIFHCKWLNIYNIIIMEADIRASEYLKLRRKWVIIKNKDE